jgi:hypothetical protein
MVDPHVVPSKEGSRLTAFCPDRPLLLLTDFPPEAKGGGAVILQSLLTPEDRKRIIWATLSPLAAGNEPNAISLAPRRHRSLLQDGTIRTAQLRRKVRAIVRERGVAAAWVVAHGAPVRVAPDLVAASLPVHITVHDDPAWAYAILTRRYLALAPLLARDLKRSLRGASSVDVVSEPMARRYRSRYGIESTIVHRGLAGPVRPSPAYDRRHGVAVAVLGSTYGLREVGTLAQALGLLSERLRLPTRLTVIGGVDQTQVKRLCPPDVALEMPGHLDEVEGVARLASSFLLYLSYPFGRRGKVLRTTSFPTKLSTYIMAARPLLLHMPADSSVASLGTKSPYATLWQSINPEDGADAIHRLWLDDRTDQSFHGAAEQVREQHFDLSNNRAVLLQTLNLLPARGLTHPPSWTS